MKWFGGSAAICLILAAFAPVPALADVRPLPAEALAGLAQNFVSRISRGFDAADQAMGVTSARTGGTVLPEGEVLFFTIGLPANITLESVVTGVVRDRRILFSFTDYVTALDFPIDVDGTSGVARGWFIREGNDFQLDVAARSVTTAKGTVPLSDRVVVENGDILATADEMAGWFGFKSQTELANLRLVIDPPVPLPIQERLARGERRFQDRRPKAPVLPRLENDDYRDRAAPFVDVSTTSVFQHDGNGGASERRHSATVATAGDFARGTLRTQSQLNETDGLSGVRATYKRESLEPELLGPLRARRYELGDIAPPSLPLDTTSTLGSGARVTNVDPMRTYLNPTTGVRGTATPGWDVELYRENQLLGFQTVGEDGIYTFENVDLFRSNNIFRVVFYGPQGETREETIEVPVDPSRLSSGAGVYDVSLTADGTQLYRRNEGPEDEGAPRLVALYEKPVGDSSAVQLGLQSESTGDDSVTTGQVGFSTVLGGAILNSAVGVDQHGEAGAEFTVRQDFGKHQFRNTVELATDEFDLPDDADNRQVFREALALNGPLPGVLGKNSRYNLDLEYLIDAQGDDITNGTVGYSGAWGPVSLSQQFTYAGTNGDSDETLVSSTALRGNVGRTRLRLDADYELLPENTWREASVNVQRRLTDDLDLQLDVSRNNVQKLTESRAQANWKSGRGTISPSIAYNSEGDTTIMLNTRLGIARNPHDRQLDFFDAPISTNGGLAAFVYLDENGNNRHDHGEPPVESATVMALQNGGAMETDADGYAFFSRLQKFRPTDVYLVRESLPDPFWVPGSRGASIVPREGHVTTMEFPVHKAGEMDGTVYARMPGGENVGLRGVSLGLYNHAGEKIMGTTTESDGFYVFSPIPPGAYFLVMDGRAARSDDVMRMDPVPVTIGYDGAAIYGRNLYLDAGTDVPLRVVADLAGLAADDPALDAERLAGRGVVLNLGSARSRLLMGLVWYKIRSFYPDAVAGLEPLVAPSESFAALKSGRHMLRVGAASLTLADARRRCAIIAADGGDCTVEILPGGLQMAAAANPAAEK